MNALENKIVLFTEVGTIIMSIGILIVIFMALRELYFFYKYKPGTGTKDMFIVRYMTEKEVLKKKKQEKRQYSYIRIVSFVEHSSGTATCNIEYWY